MVGDSSNVRKKTSQRFKWVRLIQNFIKTQNFAIEIQTIHERLLKTKQKINKSTKHQ